MINNNITRHNHENTRFVQNQQPSCIDHIYSNIPSNITNAITHNKLITDQKILSLTYTTNKQIYHQKFIHTNLIGYNN